MKRSVLLSEPGRKIRFVELTVDEAKEQWRSFGMGEETIGFLIEALGNTPEEGYTVVPTVEQVTGRAPRGFSEWAAEHAQAFQPVASA